ncbi:MAG TPA: M56 family metallopeptidase [Candidatus Dormibacteraeota bacterium]|nr:M56 family metallopeptidase [Candidatus Dormibacteraeota bacterium]
MENIFQHARFDLIVRASWQAAVLIILVLALQWGFGKRLSPRWRYAMWLLVVLRLALPWTIPSAFSPFNWVDLRSHSAAATSIDAETRSLGPTDALKLPGGTTFANAPMHFHFSAAQLLWVWAAGAVLLAGYLAYNQYRISRKVTYRRPLIDARVMNLLEDCKQVMRVRVPITLVETGDSGSPALFGFLRPRLLLPAGLTRSFSEEELRHVFLHELSHIKRNDIMVGWFMTALQIVHWFNPLVWVAFHRMRVDRELACDAMALSYAKTDENQPYGRTIIKLLEGFGCSAWGPSLAGTLEDKNQMKERISMIASFNKTNRWPGLAMALFAGLGVVALTDAQNGQPPASADAGPVGPRIVSTSPVIGAQDVDPATTEITVTFDQDMGKGFSWTGGGTDYPPGVEGKKPVWPNSRTCVLPVKLQAGRYYRVGINSTSYNNFKGVNGLAVAPAAIYFTTRGAGPDVTLKTLVPQVVSFSPINGDQNVSPDLAEVRVTFNLPMGGGCSWCTVGDTDSDFPKGREGKQYYWTDDKRTCVLPVTLESARTYRISINSPWHKNFQSEGGVPSEPVEYSFKTQ